MGFLPLDIGKVVYGGFNPNGSSRDPFIRLGRSISHGIRPGTSQDLLSPTGTATGYPPIDYSGMPPAAQVDEPVVQTNRDLFPPASPAAQAYSSIARQPNSGLDNYGVGGPTGTASGLPPGMPQRPPVYAGPGYTDPRVANNFIPGLIEWNGPGQANPSSMEDGPQANARHNIGALASKFGLMGRGGLVMPGKFK